MGNRWHGHSLQELTEQRKAKIVEMAACGDITRDIIAQELHLASCTISGLITQCIAEGKLIDIKYKFAAGGARERIVRLAPPKTEKRNWFEGWNGAPALGLEGWESVAPKQGNIIHLTSS